MTQIVLGASSLIQAAVPKVIGSKVSQEDRIVLDNFSSHYIDVLRTNANLCVNESKQCPELTVIEPQGAMYAMIKIDIDSLDGILDDTDFAQKVLCEENLFFLPGKCFGMPNFVRFVICPPEATIKEAWERLRLFCERHRKDTSDGHAKKKSKTEN